MDSQIGFCAQFKAWPPRAAMGRLALVCALCVAAAGAQAQERGQSRLAQLPALLEVPAVVAVDRPEVMRARHQAGGTLTLQRALELGVSYSLDAQMSGAQEEAQAATSRAAWLQLGPKLDARLASGKAEYTPQSGVGTPMMLRGDRSVTLRQPLIDWSGWHEALRQGHNLEAARMTRLNAESQAALESGHTYLAALQSRLVVEYTIEYEALLHKLMQYMTDRAGAGGASPADLERVRARVENIKASVSENRAGLVTNLTQFARLVGLVPEALVLPEQVLRSLPADEQAAMDLALLQNPELRVARSLAQAGLQERKGADGKWLPRLDLEIGKVQNINPSGTTGTQSDLRGLVVLSWNLFNGGVDLQMRVAQEARLRELGLKVENAERKLRQQIESQYSVLDSIALRFEAVRAELLANRKVVAAFNEQLFATNRQLLDVLDAYQRLYQSKVDLTNLVVTEAQVRLQVAQWLGVLPSAAQP